jgi:hypothetical protein
MNHVQEDYISILYELSELDLALYQANPEIAKTIIRLYEEGFECSEESMDCKHKLMEFQLFRE